MSSANLPAMTPEQLVVAEEKFNEFYTNAGGWGAVSGVQWDLLRQDALNRAIAFARGHVVIVPNT